MAKYDFSCASCGWVGERSCPIAEADAQHCEQCGSLLSKLFSPPDPSGVYVPGAFRLAFSDLFGTSSEKDYIKANPNLERVNMSTYKPPRDKMRERWAKAKKEGDDIERAINANQTLVHGEERRPGQRVKVDVTGKPRTTFKRGNKS